MKELIAFLLPPAIAAVGMRLNRLILGETLLEKFGFGCRFALGLATGMVVFSQGVLLTAIIGINASTGLAWTGLVWGAIEVILLAPHFVAGFKKIKFQPGHLWLLLLLPVLYSWWVFGQLCTLEGTLEFDANAFWVFKAKILYLMQGKDLINIFHQSNLSYAHLDYPILVPCLYTLDYGAVDGVDEFVNKVWPFWMVVTLSLAILSLARVLQNPRPLPMLVVVLVCFLPATLQYIRQEGGTIPMFFFTGLTTLLMMSTFINKDAMTLAAGVLALVGCVTTKFEGIIYAALWSLPAMVLCWRHGWLKSRVIWKAAVIAAVCLVPYVCLRLTKPVLHPESGWIKNGLANPGQTCHRFPQVFFLNVGNRFFSQDYFRWSTNDKDHIQFNGQWNGAKSLINSEVSILPWLLPLLTLFSFWKKPGYRVAIGTLAAITLGYFAILAFAISCQPTIQADITQAIGGACDGMGGRYLYPIILAFFLGVMAVWISDPTPVTDLAEKSALQPSARPKKRR
jgi:hypothetical protein